MSGGEADLAAEAGIQPSGFLLIQGLLGGAQCILREIVGVLVPMGVARGVAPLWGGGGG